MNKENNLYKACQGNNFSEERYVLLETGEFPSKYKMSFDNAHYLDLNKITDEDLKRTFTKLSLVAGYKLQIVIVSLYDYKKNDIEFLLMPISKVELDDIMVKYLSEK